MLNKKNILKNISDLKLFYEGNHNKTYQGFFCKEVVQVRIAKNKIVNHNNELIFLENNNNVLYIDNELMIKKWIPGAPLNKNDINTLKALKQSLNKHWRTTLSEITHFANIEYDKSDIVLSHGDLRPQNIIIDNEGKIHLIDYEWINYNSKYFDLAHLNLYCFFTIQDIVEVFEIEIEKLQDYIIKVKKFNDHWEKTNTKKI